MDLDMSSKFRNLDWEKAKTFYYVASMGSFSTAAHLLRLTPSTLSYQISILEKSLGFPLLLRQSDGIKLSRKGEEFFEKIEKMFLMMKEFIALDEKNAPLKKRTIKFATTHILVSYVFLELLINYQKSNPHINFEIIAEDNYLDLLLNDIDIAIRPLDKRVKKGERRAEYEEYDYLFGLEKKLFASKKYLEKYGEPQTVEDLKHHHLIAHSNAHLHPYADINWILRLGMPAGEFLKPVLMSNSVDVSIEAAREGIGIVATYSEFNDLKKAHLINILPEVKCPTLQSYFVLPKYLKEDKIILDIKQYLKENLKNLNFL